MSIHLIAIHPDGHAQTELLANNELAQTVCLTTAKMYQTTGFGFPWIGYLPVNEGELVETCAFRTAPREGRVEIAYFTFPPYEGRGLATEMARCLIQCAQRETPEVLIMALTSPQPNASTAILGKLGFLQTGVVETSEDGLVWEWQLPHAQAPIGCAK